MLNHISLIGRLVADPEERTLPSGDTHVRFALAVDRPYTNKQGEREADFIDIVSIGRDKETLKTYAKKGEPLSVEGRLRIRTYTTDDGETRKVAEVVLDRFYFLRGLRQDRNQEDDRPRESAVRHRPRRTPSRSRPVPTRNTAARKNPPDDPGGDHVPF